MLNATPEAKIPQALRIAASNGRASGGWDWDELRPLGVTVVSELRGNQESWQPNGSGPVHAALVDPAECKQDCQTLIGRLKSQGVCVVVACPWDGRADYLQLGADGVVPSDADPQTVAAALLSAQHQKSLRTALEQEVRQLVEKLEHVKLIGQAKAIMAEQLHISEAEALRNLRSEARKRRRPMHELAKVLVEAQEIIATKSKPGMKAVAQSSASAQG